MFLLERFQVTVVDIMHRNSDSLLSFERLLKLLMFDMIAKNNPLNFGSQHSTIIENDRKF